MSRAIQLCLLLTNLLLVLGQNAHKEHNGLDAMAHVRRLNTNARKYSEEVNSGEPSGVFSYRFNTDLDQAIERADELLATQDGDSPHNVSAKCRLHTDMFLLGIANRSTWALHMLDAFGKPGSDLMNLHLTWLGSYDECLAVRADAMTGTPFNGRYCLVSYAPVTQPQYSLLNLGMCLSDSCSSEDAGLLVSDLFSLLRLNISSDFVQSKSVCQVADREYSSKAIAVIVVCSLFLAVMIAATTYDIMLKVLSSDDTLPMKYEKSSGHSNGSVVADTSPLLTDQPNGHAQVPNNSYQSLDKSSHTGRKQGGNNNRTGLAGKLLLSFSVYTNAPKVFNTSAPAGTLTAVNGVRFYSMLWVILGHTYAFIGTSSDNYANIVPEWLKRFSFQAISNATFAVDTFFVLSGLLVAYLSLKEMKKRGSAKNFKWGMFYFHRFWRLTPPYMLFLMLYVPLVKYWGDGPAWSQEGVEIDECRDTWWTNLLYINNLYKNDKMCMGWSWYLANDMQFYVISPLFLISFYYSGILGSIVSICFIAISFISTGVISTRNKLPANLMFAETASGFEDIYIKPWCRIGPYAVGMATGYFLYVIDCKIRIPKVINLIGWFLSAVVSVAILYGLYSPDGSQRLGVEMSALYNATSRTAWGACIAWVVFACATGHGGPVNSLLSWPAIIPLSRLTYCAYLVHPVVMYTYYMSRRTLIHLYDFNMIYLFLGNACLAYAVAFVISLAFESPMMGLEKVLLGRSKNS